MINKLFSEITTVNPGSDYDRNYYRLANSYDRFVFFLLLIYSVFVQSFFGDTLSFIFLVSIFLSWLILILLHKQINSRPKLYKAKTFLVLMTFSFVAGFFHIYSWKEAGFEYFYFSVLVTIPFVLNYKEDFNLIVLSIGIVALNFIGSTFLELDFVPKRKIIVPADTAIVRFAGIVFFFIKFLLDMYFIFQKDQLIYYLIEETEIKDSTIETLEKANNNIKNECFEEVVELARSNSPEFFTRFREVYPGVVTRLLEINPRFRVSELTLCAYIFLGFTTKDIASCTFTSINTVKVRKYNLRKKLNIPAEVSTEMWFKDLVVFPGK